MRFSIKFLLGFIVAGAVSLLFVQTVPCDTIVKTDRERIKGVVVEEYRDRVVISTLDGERQILRDDIESITYDDEDQNFTHLGDRFQDRAMYQQAYYYYSQALRINPDNKGAKEGLDFTGAMIQQSGRRRKLDHIDRLEHERAWRRGTDQPVESMEQQLRNILGFSVGPYDANFKVTRVYKSSPASEGGLEEGDVIISVWGRLVGYTRPEEFMARIVAPEVLEVKMTVEREVEINMPESGGNLDAVLGANMVYSATEGFNVSNVIPDGRTYISGIASGDIICEIDGRSTRYMPRKEMQDMFLTRRGTSVPLKIRRELSLWKRTENR